MHLRQGCCPVGATRQCHQWPYLPMARCQAWRWLTPGGSPLPMVTLPNGLLPSVAVNTHRVALPTSSQQGEGAFPGAGTPSRVGKAAKRGPRSTPKAKAGDGVRYYSGKQSPTRHQGIMSRGTKANSNEAIKPYHFLSLLQRRRDDCHHDHPCHAGRPNRHG